MRPPPIVPCWRSLLVLHVPFIFNIPSFLASFLVFSFLYFLHNKILQQVSFQSPSFQKTETLIHNFNIFVYVSTCNIWVSYPMSYALISKITFYLHKNNTHNLLCSFFYHGPLYIFEDSTLLIFIYTKLLKSRLKCEDTNKS